MLPLVIQEEQIFSFEFWLNGSIHRGMHYRGELYCKLQTSDIYHRSQVYQLGCKLQKRSEPIILTCTPTTCSLWGSLRSSTAREFLLHPEVFALPGLEVGKFVDAVEADRPIQ